MSFVLKPTIIKRSNTNSPMPPLEDRPICDDLNFDEMDEATLKLKCKLFGRTIKTGCKNIDKLLSGGIPVDGIVEISGESSCGKTQICLQLAITVQYPETMGGLDAGVIYICTEDAFPSKRLSDLCEEFVKHLPKPPKTIDIEKNIFVIHVYDLKQFQKCLFEQVPNLISRMKIGLIIIDSIAGIFRYDCGIPWNEKLTIIDKVAKKLNDFINDDYVAVVCVNQVTTQIEDGISKLIPSLGDSWGNHVLYRIQLERSRDETNPERTFNVTLYRDLVGGVCKFAIQPYGII